MNQIKTGGQEPMKKLIAVSTLVVSMLIASPTFAQEVKPGDTMSKIARENNMSLQELAEANPINQKSFFDFSGTRNKHESWS